MKERDDATMRQIHASRSDRSTWLSANAGSGKTKVLTDRVARLLLDGVDPQNVLCLTYTKAAASEMQNRLFERLGAWAMLADDPLKEALSDLGHGDVITNDMLPTARRLFARAIETPGGLKIQTIHSFCSGLLRKFPFEAQVTPNFTEMEERASILLRSEIVEAMAGGPERDLVEGVAEFSSDMTLESLTGRVAARRTEFARGFDEPMMRKLLGLPDGFDDTDLLTRVFLGGELELISSLNEPLLKSGNPKAHDFIAGKKLKQISDLSVSALEGMEPVFLHGHDAKRGAPFSAKIGSFPTQTCRKTIPHLMPELDALMARVEEARERRVALLLFKKTKALHRFATAFLSKYERAKLLRGWLDFDDLILRARDLLQDKAVADWVLYKLDGRIDHILVDEAQDTSPAQWQVIEALARDFTSGQGTKEDAPRTIFVVGDKKQSIYSFQGADPREFDRMKAEFKARLGHMVTPLQDLQMEYSFRSAPCILSLVDQVFEERDRSGFEPEQGHISFKTDLPGRVDLWDVIEAPDKPKDPAWYDPVDIKSPDNPQSLLARCVADFIKKTIGTALPGQAGKGRKITAGDILILVRRRSDVFHDIIRECKSRELPVAGADRLKVGAELAVKDLKALLSVLATPEDDLSLACALRSPLFGWSEGDLYDLAQGRAQPYLAAELRDRAEAFPATVAMLNDLRDQVDFLRPYDLIDRILTRHEGRRKLLGRLGTEAEDGIDALLSQALAYERNAVDSLTGFLVWMETDDLEIKRQLDTAGDQIRVMTVHGAKGLEAPIVILPDTALWQKRGLGVLAETEAGVMWRSSKEDATALQRGLEDTAQEAEEAERDRLLYVAMTRAEQWLVVAAAGQLGKDGRSWHDQVRMGMEALGARAFDDGLRLENGNWDQGIEPLEQLREDGLPALPAYMRDAAPKPEERGSTLSPSDLGGAKALPDERGLDEDAAKRRGRQVHRLLEVLPEVTPERWPEVAKRLLSGGPDGASDEERALLLAEAQKIFEKPSLAALFQGNALSEVPITANLDLLGGRRVHGVIDRLILGETKVLAVDFKTNAMVPELVRDCPAGLLRQMGAYAQALAQIYPSLEIETAILWTRTATLMHLPHDLVTGALADTYIS
ncbi:MAG: double-strand break repair helicase AddA [Pseudomonadota bacterium]